MTSRITFALMLATGTSMLASVAIGAPTVSGVSGTIGNGQTVTISGSGFGTKPQAQPMLFDDFEGGANGALIANSAATIGRWDTGAGSDKVFYSTAVARTGSKAAFHDFITTYNASLAKNTTFSRLYMDFWIYTSYVDRISRNFKPWRFYGDSDQLQLDFVWLCNGELLNRVQSNAGWSQGDWGGPRYVKNQWMHVQLVYGASSPGVANGTIRHYLDSQAAPLDSGAIVTQMRAAQFDQIRIGHYWADDGVPDCAANGGARVYTDNVYLDTSWARVEIGDAPTYAASRQREIQIPTAWSDGSVAIRFNAGRFAPGTTVYLYVTDANNVTSAGRPVVIGAAGVAPPNAPTSVRAD